MKTILDMLSGGGLISWLLLFAVIVVGIILLRRVFRLATTVVRIGCLILFIVAVGAILFTFFGGS